MTEEEWQKLLATVDEIQEWFPEGVAFIGGIAVYAHAMAKDETAQYAAKSHDADFMILLPEFVDLRDIEALTPNRRLGKQQFVKNGYEFDVYVEGQNDLPVPAAEALVSSEIKSGLRVACCEHLLVLKAAALLDRRGSAKGDKDEDDIVRIMLVADALDTDKLSRLTDAFVSEIERAVAGDAVLRLASGNKHLAKALRNKTMARLGEIRQAHRDNYGGCEP